MNSYHNKVQRIKVKPNLILRRKISQKNILSPNGILGDPKDGVKTRRKIKNILSHLCFISKIDLKKVKKA